MKPFTLSILIGALATVVGCSSQTPEPKRNIAFLAFGDGGYSVDYPKPDVMLEALDKTGFIAKEREEWLEEHRPADEFGYPPIHIYPNNVATERSGAMPVGEAMAALCREKSCDFAIQLGDNIYPDGAGANDGKDDQQRMNDLILAPLLPLLKQQPEIMVYSALGNHDWKTSRKGVALQTQWMAQQPQFHMDPKGYYRYVVGEPGNDIEFFVLDTNMLLSGQTFYEIPLNPDGSEGDLQQALADGTAQLEIHDAHEGPVNGEDIAQLNWLKQGLASSKAKWKMVYGHHILWSIGGTKYSEGHVLRALLMPTLCRYADAYIAGHEHDLELLSDDCSSYPESKSQGPLPLIISGAASKMRGVHTPFAKQQQQKYPQMQLLWNKSFTWGFARIELDNQAQQFEVTFYTTPINGNGELVTEQSFNFARRSH